jgi:Na+/proline symporter
MLVRVLGSAVALYSIAVLACALIHLPDPETLNRFSAILVGLVRDGVTGTFSVPVAIVLIGLIIIIISGNLWAVLITDGLQFIVLAVSVTIVVPMLLNQDAVGGWSGFLEAARHTPALFKHGGELMNAPGKTLLSPSSGPFTWLFLGGWIIIHCFKIGGEWSFVQRFTCVPTRRDAVKVGLIFGVLYLLSPLVWMLPPMIYRVMHPVMEMAPGDVSRLAEQAYILACASVLPAGLVGLLVAAMLSATISMVDSEVNVYAGAVTRDIYARLTHREQDDRHLVRAGRIFTVLISLLVIVVAIAIPHLGGAQNVILTITGLFVGPMVLPTIWGLFSKRVGASAVYITVLTGALCSAILKFGVSNLAFVQENSRSLEVLVGIIPPLLTLAALEWLGKAKRE